MWVVACPHCGDIILIEEINCAIFRHGVWKETMTPINPHATKEECVDMVERGLIYGCGKPFQTIRTKDDQYTAVPCGYL